MSALGISTGEGTIGVAGSMHGWQQILVQKMSITWPQDQKTASVLATCVLRVFLMAHWVIAQRPNIMEVPLRI